MGYPSQTSVSSGLGYVECRETCEMRTFSRDVGQMFDLGLDSSPRPASPLVRTAQIMIWDQLLSLLNKSRNVEWWRA